MPVPDVEELAAQLEGGLFLNSKALHDGYVMVVVTEAPVVGNARTLAKVEIEAIEVFKRELIEQRLVRIKAAFALSPRSEPRLEPWNAPRRELARRVALTGAEEERDARTSANDRSQSPPADKPVQYPAGPSELCMVAKRSWSTSETFLKLPTAADLLLARFPGSKSTTRSHSYKLTEHELWLLARISD